MWKGEGGGDFFLLACPLILTPAHTCLPCLSGEYTAKPFTDYECNDILSGFAHDLCSDLSCCKSLCDNDPNCDVFMFGDGYGDPPANRCWTKSNPGCSPIDARSSGAWRGDPSASMTSYVRNGESALLQ